MLLLWVGWAHLATPADGAARGPALPRSLVGEWTSEKGNCDPQSETRLSIEPRLVMFYASAYSVKRIAKRRDGSLKISGQRSDEGEGSGSTADTVELRLITPDLLLADGQTYYRCKASR